MRCVRPLKPFLKLGLFLMLLLLFMVPDTAMAGKPVVKVEMGSTGKIWVGQKTVLIVKLYSPAYFSGAPRFDLPEVPGLVILKVPGRPVVGSEQFGNDTYSVQTHEFFIYPQRAGSVAIPSFSVQFDVAGVGMAKPSRHVLNTRQLHFRANMPAGAEQLQTLISARKLDAREAWLSMPEYPVIGDAFTRTITFRAPDIPGMAFPPIPPMDVPGLAIYPGPAQVRDKVNRGDLTGERVETLTYVCEQTGQTTIPALVFHWWDLSAKRLRKIEFPAVQLTVVADPDLVAAIPIAVSQGLRLRDFFGLILASGLLLLILTALFCLRRRIRLFLQCRHQQHVVSEKHAFVQLLRSCRQPDPAPVLNAFWIWMERLRSEVRIVTLGDLKRKFPELQLAAELQILEQSILDRRKGWKGKELTVSLRTLRKSIFALPYCASTRSLPDLNPRHHRLNDY